MLECNISNELTSKSDGRLIVGSLSHITYTEFHGVQISIEYFQQLFFLWRLVADHGLPERSWTSCSFFP